MEDNEQTDLPKVCSITLDLPLPPSINRLWKVGRRGPKAGMYRSPEYMSWLKQAGLAIMIQRPKLPVKGILGTYEMTVKMVRRSSRQDLDNHATKALGDLLQRHYIVENDKLCVKYTAEWCEELPNSCQVILSKPLSQDKSKDT